MNLTEEQAAEKMGIEPSNVSALHRGHFQDYNVDCLMTFLNDLGHGVKICVSEERDFAHKATIEIVTAL